MTAMWEISEVVYKVRLRGTQFDGVEATLTGCSAEQYLKAQRSDAALLDSFGEHLQSWNLAYNGEPIPSTPESVAKADAKLMLSLATGWLAEQVRPVRDNPTQPLVPMNGTGGEAMTAL